MSDSIASALAVAAFSAAALHASRVSSRQVNHQEAAVVAKLLHDENLERALELASAAGESVFFQGMKGAMLETTRLRGLAGAPTGGSHRERHAPQVVTMFADGITAAFERPVAWGAQRLLALARLGLLAAALAGASLWMQGATGAFSVAMAASLDGLTLVIVGWSTWRSWTIPRASRRAFAALLPLLTRHALGEPRDTAAR